MSRTHVKTLLFQKVFDLLSADATLNRLLGGDDKTPGRILTAKRDGTPYPNLLIRTPELADWSGHDFDGFEGHVDVVIWDQGESEKAIAAISERVYYVLHAIDAGISGFPTINFRCTLDSTDIEPDNRTRQCLQRYSVKLGGN